MRTCRLGIKIGAVAAGLLLPLLFVPRTVVIAPSDADKPPSSVVREYLVSKGSPLAEHAELLLQQEDWKLLIAISRIESSWCTKKVDFNCWGIGGDSEYRHYGSYPEAILDAQRVIQRWQDKGRWLTVEDMNCHYVQPCNQNWVNVVSSTLQELEKLQIN